MVSSFDIFKAYIPDPNKPDDLAVIWKNLSRNVNVLVENWFHVSDLASMTAVKSRDNAFGRNFCNKRWIENVPVAERVPDFRNTRLQL